MMMLLTCIVTKKKVAFFGRELNIYFPADSAVLKRRLHPVCPRNVFLFYTFLIELEQFILIDALSISLIVT